MADESITNNSSREAAHARQTQLTKPQGSLGWLEDVAVCMAGLQHQALPSSRPAAAVIVASDHPVAAMGVSAYPAAVTPAMVHNIAGGGAAASVLAKAADVPLTLLDVGVEGLGELSKASFAFRYQQVDVGVEGDLVDAPALDESVLDACLAAGADFVATLDAELRVLAVGELGIGNTTTAAATCAALLDAPADVMTGAGTGVVGDALRRKQTIVETAAGPVRGASARAILSAVGGRDIATMAGIMIACGRRGVAVLVDGYVASAAALAATRIEPSARGALIFAHESAEPGHRIVLEAMNARALIRGGLRLGECSGALLAIPMIDAACALHRDMATFESASVPGRDP